MTSTHSPIDVVAIGANSVDHVYTLPGYPQPHGAFAKMRIEAHRVLCGGQAATTVATCVRLGLTARYVGVTGNDEHGRLVREEMQRYGIGVDQAIVRDAPNQFAVILLEREAGERIVLWDRDSALALRDEELPHDTLMRARLIHVDDVDEDAAIRAALMGREHGIPVTSDLDRLTPRTEALVAAVSLPILAEHLTTQLTGEADQERALRKLRRLNEGTLVVTLGERGAMALCADRVVLSEGFKVDAVDTTGSGDVFRGGFIFGLLSGWPMERTLRFANAAAAVSCTRLGALNGAPTLQEVLALLGPEC